MEPKYKILSQTFPYPSEKTLIIFQAYNCQEQIIQSAEQLVNNPDLLNGFSIKDIALIKHIAEAEVG